VRRRRTGHWSLAARDPEDGGIDVTTGEARPRPPKRRAARGDDRPLLSTAERAALGREARRRTPRSGNASLDIPPDRADPIALLERQAETRVPELVPIRYGRMLESPFAFYRGAALIMASDIASAPRTGFDVQLCGDAHLSNFGVFASPERRLIFDINDFDETLQGPWEWDVKRLAASIEVAARERGFTARDRGDAVQRTARAYREAMRRFAQMRTLDVWYARLEIEAQMADLRRLTTKEMHRTATRVLAKARTRDSLQAFSKLATVAHGEPRIVADPPLIEPIEDLSGDMPADELRAALEAILAAYRRTLQRDRRHLLKQYRLVHVARKVVGVGSVGTRAWIALMVGRDTSDPLFLQLKEAGPSVLEGFVHASRFANHGERVVTGQRLMQASSDIFLGWTRVRAGFDGRERDFYVRQLRDWKGSADVASMVPAGMALYAELCAWTLARAHARSGDSIAIAAYLGSGDAFDRAVRQFAGAYADQNQRDYEALVAAVESGRIAALKGA
jgi:uncharacterized protein (DUF2252 family)